MEPVTVLPVDASTIQRDPAIGALLAEYAHEARMDGMPEPDPSWAMYDALEKAGVLHCFAAYVDDMLVGWLALVCAENPHYSRVVGNVESWFVSKSYRWTGAGMRLLRMAEGTAERLGAVGVLAAARKGSRAAEVMPRSGYGVGETAFFKRLGV